MAHSRRAKRETDSAAAARAGDAASALAGVALRSAAQAASDESRQRGTEASLRASEKALRKTLEDSPGIMWVTELGGRCTFVNRRWTEYTGQTAEQALGHCWLELIHPEDRAGASQALAQASGAQQPFRFEHRLRNRAGSYGWFINAANPRFDDAGVFLGHIGWIVDITEQRAAELAARANMERLSRAMSAAKLGYWSWDAATDNVRVSEWLCELVGLDAGAVIGSRDALALVHDTDRHRVAQRVREAVAAGGEIELECRVRGPDAGGAGIALHGRLDFGPDGALLGMRGIARDTTARKRAERALRTSDERLRVATRTGKVGVWDWDVVRNRITWTESLYEIHGLKPAEYDRTVEAFFALIHSDDRTTVQRAMQCSLEHDVPCELEFRAFRSGGAVIWLYTSAVVVRENGQAVRMLGATLDITARKHAELALRESEARFRALASHAPVGVFLSDAQGGCLFVNGCWRAMAGLSTEQARGRGWMQALHPDDAERVQREWSAAVESRAPFVSEHRMQHADGRVTWVQGGAVEFKNASGAVVGFIGIMVDITERKAAEEALRASEKRFRTLASHAPVGIFLTDPAGQTVFVNESWCAMAGLTAEQALGTGWVRSVHPEDRERVVAQWEDARRRGVASTSEYRFRHDDGTVTWVSGNAVQWRDEHGILAGYIGTITDVTQRKSAEDRLRAQERQLRFISTNAPINLAHCDREGRFLFVNRAYAERLGLEPEGILGRSIAEILGPTALAAIQPRIDRVLAGESFTYEAEVPYHTIGPRYMRVSYAPDRAEDGTVRGWLAVATDMTERQQMENELRSAQAQLQVHAAELEQNVQERTASLRAAIAQMEEFSYSVSHDLRAPLRAMNAYAQALVEDYGPQLDATARSYIDRIQRGSQRMEALTHDVLTYSRVARADTPLTGIDLTTLLRDVVSQYRELQPPAATVEIAPDLARVRAHESTLCQCLANLLTNAAKFVPDGVHPHIRVRTERAGMRVRVWVEDNGIGISPSDHGRLFRVFERAPTRQPYAGTGIGLAIVRKAAEKMGGRCGVESDGKNGSSFWIELETAAPDQ